MSPAASVSHDGPLALICGGGSLPLAVADSAAARGRRVLLFPVRGAADPADYAGRADQHWVHYGQFGTVARVARSHHCRDMVLLGWLVRPSLRQLRPDFLTLRVLPHVVRAFRGGDDHLLSSIARVIERHGFCLLGAHEVAPEILMPEGVLGRAQPSERDRADVALGFDYLRAAGPFDIGQAVVVANNHVLAVEAAEGTDHMLARVAQLRQSGRISAAKGTGVLVKAPKPAQDRRFDLPSIGPRTVEGVAAAGLGGMAVTAGSTIIAEPGRLIQAADRTNVFVLGAPT